MNHTTINSFVLVWRFVAERPLAWLLNFLMLCLGLATLVLVVTFQQHLHNKMLADAQGVNLVVGAKGSPLQLVLSSVYHVDVPTGNIPQVVMDNLQEERGVKQMVPVLLGDSFDGFRIVGTSVSYFNFSNVILEEGEIWQKPLQVVLGSEVAKRTGLKIGARFVGSHGLVSAGAASEHVHAHAPYTVVGVLAPSGTIADRLVLTDSSSVWLAHGMVPGVDLAVLHEQAEREQAKHEIHHHEEHHEGDHDDSLHHTHAHEDYGHDHGHEHLQSDLPNVAALLPDVGQLLAI